MWNHFAHLYSFLLFEAYEGLPRYLSTVLLAAAFFRQPAKGHFLTATAKIKNKPQDLESVFEPQAAFHISLSKQKGRP